MIYEKILLKIRKIMIIFYPFDILKSFWTKKYFIDKNKTQTTLESGPPP